MDAVAGSPLDSGGCSPTAQVSAQPEGASHPGHPPAFHLGPGIWTSCLRCLSPWQLLPGWTFHFEFITIISLRRWGTAPISHLFFPAAWMAAAGGPQAPRPGRVLERQDRAVGPEGLSPAISLVSVWGGVDPGPPELPLASGTGGGSALGTQGCSGHTECRAAPDLSEGWRGKRVLSFFFKVPRAWDLLSCGPSH